MEVQSFSEIEAAFIERVNRMVWCNVATVDAQNRPRSRVLHTIWEGQVGWIATRRNSYKTRHLERNPHVSLAYTGDFIRPVYVDCVAEWDDSAESKQRIWDLFLSTPEPLGYDPAPIFKSVDHPDYGLLKLTPWRIELTDATAPNTRQVWHR
jgi:general stress protein 26